MKGLSNEQLAQELEAWAVSEFAGYDFTDRIPLLLQVIAALRAPSATEAAVPEGWQLVPKNLTQEVWQAARDVMPNGHANIDEIYRAMLAAASPAKQPKGE